VREAVVTCERCRRLRTYCQRIGRNKRAAYLHETYWAKPVPGFGDPDARIVLVGLAPAAHGANRTGRMFTGDGTGGSSDFLARALHATGLASQPFSVSRDDGQTLIDTWMTAAVRCAPPDNKPTPREMANCYPYLKAELAALPRARVVVALGRIAFDACWRWLSEGRSTAMKRPAFGHGVVVHREDGMALVGSYHPSRQNTHTGRLTPAMLQDVCRTAMTLAGRA
jgi:uracil-DNA glycosylase